LKLTGKSTTVEKKKRKEEKNHVLEKLLKPFLDPSYSAKTQTKKKKKRTKR
jgi:hypothetical protein